MKLDADLTVLRPDLTDGGGTLEAQLKRRAASGAGNTSGGSNTPSGSEPQEGVLTTMMVAQQSDENPQPDVSESTETATIRRLQAALEKSLRARQALADRLGDSMARNVELAKLGRHWFVPDAAGAYCAACGLPVENARHAPRAA